MSIDSGSPDTQHLAKSPSDLGTITDKEKELIALFRAQQEQTNPQVSDTEGRTAIVAPDAEAPVQTPNHTDSERTNAPTSRRLGKKGIAAITAGAVGVLSATVLAVTQRGEESTTESPRPTLTGSKTPGAENTPTPTQTIERLSAETFSYFYNGTEYIGKEGFVNSMITRGAIQPTPEEGERILRSSLGHFNAWVTSGVNTPYEVDTVSRPVLSGNGHEMTNEAFADIISRDVSLDENDPLVKTVKTMNATNMAAWYGEDGTRQSQEAHDAEFTYLGIDVVSVENVFTDGMVVTGRVTIQANSPDITDKKPTVQKLDMRLAINANAEWEFMHSTEVPRDK
jgi:flagellar capping protein FliD